MDTEVVPICGYHPLAAAARSLSVFPCTRVQASLPVRRFLQGDLPVMPEMPHQLSRTVSFYFATQVMDSHGEKSTVQINQGTKRMKPTLWFSSSHPPTFRENHMHSGFSGSQTPQQPHLQEDTQGSPALLQLLLFPQGLPPDAFFPRSWM